MNPLLERDKKPTRYYSDRHEKSTAKSLGGQVQSGSGSGSFNKGDVVTDDILIECKTAMTEKKSFAIKLEWLDKIEEQAFSMRKTHGVLAFDFGKGKNYYILNERAFKEFMKFVASQSEE